MVFYGFLAIAKQNQAEVWPRLKSLLKLMLWTKVLNESKYSIPWVCCAIGNVFGCYLPNTKLHRLVIEKTKSPLDRRPLRSCPSKSWACPPTDLGETRCQPEQKRVNINKRPEPFKDFQYQKRTGPKNVFIKVSFLSTLGTKNGWARQGLCVCAKSYLHPWIWGASPSALPQFQFWQVLLSVPVVHCQSWSCLRS